MKGMIFAMSLAFLIGLFAIPRFTQTAYAFESSNAAAVTAPASYRAVAWHRYWRDRDDYDGPPVVNHYYYSYEPEPYYDYDYGYRDYPPYYYYGPGFSIGLPFFSFHIG